MIKVIVGTLVLCTATLAQAKSPLWTFTPDPAYPPSVAVTQSGTATIKYVITNQSKKSHTLVMSPIAGISQTTSGAGDCQIPFVLGMKESCVLNLLAHGDQLSGNIVGGPMVCEANGDNSPDPHQCYQPVPGSTLNITLSGASAVLNASTNSLIASVTGLTLDGQSSGTARTITIANTGTSTAENVQYTLSSALPAGSTLTPSDCGNLAPSATCVLTLTPGATPSAAVNDTSATPILLNVFANATNTLVIPISILTYGSVYQEGYVFSMTETTDTSMSITGKTVALADQTPAYPNGVAWTPLFTDISNVNINATIRGGDLCNGATDGACNTTVIADSFTPVSTYPLTSYSAGICVAYEIDNAGNTPCESEHTCYNNWYLPAICEMGYYAGACQSGGQPLIQNIQTNLSDSSIVNLNVGQSYWSSTQNDGGDAWYGNYQYDNQDPYTKAAHLTIRCAADF